MEIANEELRRQLARNEAEVSRLHRLLAPEPKPAAPEPAEPKLKVSVLKPKPPPPPEEDEDELALGRQRVIASSTHESMTWYQQGMGLMESRKYDEAVSAFTRFLQMEPEHVYADRAQYWIGECHFRNREYGLAVISFNLVGTRYPESVRLPESMYKAALAHLAMGQKKSAKGMLQDLLRQFPLDGMASPASKKLAELASPASGTF